MPKIKLAPHRFLTLSFFGLFVFFSRLGTFIVVSLFFLFRLFATFIVIVVFFAQFCGCFIFVGFFSVTLSNRRSTRFRSRSFTLATFLFFLFYMMQTCFFYLSNIVVEDTLAVSFFFYYGVSFVVGYFFFYCRIFSCLINLVLFQ